MKIAIIMPLAEQRGGAELALVHLIQQGRALGVEWQVIFLQEGPMVAHMADLGVQTEVVNAGHVRNLSRFVATVTRIAALLRRERADVVVGWMSKAHLYSGTAARLSGIPALWFQHGITSQHWMDRLATRIPARGILACSQSAAKAQAQLKPSRPIQVVYPTVDLKRFNSACLPTPTEARQRLGLTHDGPLIGMVARLQRQKGTHILIEAMPEVLRSHPGLRTVIVGGIHDLEPDYPAHLEERVASLGLQEQVIFAGLQNNVQEWIQAMDIVANVSENEGFGIAIIEAMALGKPVVAGDAAGPTEIITPGVDGLLSPFGDAEALAQAICRYLDDPAWAQSVGAAARERALMFSTQNYAQNFVQAVRDLLSAPKA